MPEAKSASDGSLSARLDGSPSARGGGPSPTTGGGALVEGSSAVPTVDVLRHSSKPPASSANPTTSHASTGAPVNGSPFPFVCPFPFVSSTRGAVVEASLGSEGKGSNAPLFATPTAGVRPRAGLRFRSPEPGGLGRPSLRGGFGGTSPPLTHERPALVSVQFDGQFTPEVVMTHRGGPGQVNPVLLMKHGYPPFARVGVEPLVGVVVEPVVGVVVEPVVGVVVEPVVGVVVEPVVGVVGVVVEPVVGVVVERPVDSGGCRGVETPVGAGVAGRDAGGPWTGCGRSPRGGLRRPRAGRGGAGLGRVGTDFGLCLEAAVDLRAPEPAATR
jgi:hypothetical protein